MPTWQCVPGSVLVKKKKKKKKIKDATVLMTSFFPGAFLQSFQRHLEEYQQKTLQLSHVSRGAWARKGTTGFKDDHNHITYRAKTIHTQLQHKFVLGMRTLRVVSLPKVWP